MIYPIVIYGHQVLRNETVDIDKNYPELDKLIEDMFQTMYNADGSMIPAYIYGIKYERVQPPVLDAEIEVLATGATLYRIGRIRILSLVDFLYGTSITIGVGDRPTTKAVGFGTRHNGSAYITMLRMEVTTSGSVGVFLVGYYNTTTGYTGVASGDVYNAIAIWYVAE